MLRKLLFRNFRFIYRISQWLRRRLTPAGSLILGTVIAAGIFGIDTRQSLAFQIFSVSTGLILVSMLWTFTFRSGFRLQRLLPEYATAGVPLHYKFRVENLGRRLQGDLVLIDELETRFPDYVEFAGIKDPQDRNRNWLDRLIGYPRLISLIHKKRGGAIPLEVIPPVPARDRAEMEVSFTPARRGYLRFSSARIARPDPLGLFRAIRTFPLSESLLVLPRTYRIPRFQLPGRRKYQQGGLTLASQIGDSQEFLSLREYQPGDPLRTIHWRSYAKYGEPIVKEFQDEYFVRQGMVLDTFTGNGSNPLFEEAVSVAASFQLAMEEQESLLDLMFVGDRAYRFTSGRGFGKAANMMEILACVEPCRDATPSALEALLLQHAGELSGLIMIMLDWDKSRQDIVRSLIAADIPIVVLVIRREEDMQTPDAGPMQENPERLVFLPAGDIQNGLDNVNWRLD